MEEISVAFFTDLMVSSSKRGMSFWITLLNALKMLWLWILVRWKLMSLVVGFAGVFFLGIASTGC